MRNSLEFNNSNFSSELGEKGKDKKEIEDSEIKLSRREFLKGLVAGAGLAVGTKLLEKFSREKDKQKLLTGKINKKEPLPTHEQKSIEEENEKSIAEILDYHQKEIYLNPDKIKEVQNFWQIEYQENPGLRRSFEQAYFEMGAWEKKLKKIFREELIGILPQEQAEDLIYLAIPESHWHFKANSSKGAVGPYQIIKSTAKKYGLKMNQSIDERIDPELSARTCARIIKDLLKDFNGNLDLAISGYNGSLVYQYKKSVRGKDLSYEGFLKYIEEEVNQLKNKIEKEKFWVYKVHRGDNLRKISKNFGVPINNLCQINHIQNEDKISIGQKIKIPIKKSDQKKIFNHQLVGIKENLVYPAKYKAILELIHQKFVRHQKKELYFQTIKIKPFIHQVKKSETLYGLSQKYKVGMEKILEFNPKIKADNLPAGYHLTIPLRYSNLAEISQYKNISLSHLKEINPAIKNIYAKLPVGFEVRV